MKLRIHYRITEKLRNYGKFTELRTGISDYGQNPKHYGFVPRVTPESLCVGRMRVSKVRWKRQFSE